MIHQKLLGPAITILFSIIIMLGSVLFTAIGFAVLRTGMSSLNGLSFSYLSGLIILLLAYVIQGRKPAEKPEKQSSFSEKKVSSGKWKKFIIAVLVAVLVFSAFSAVFSVGGGYRKLIPTYLEAIEEQDYDDICEVVQSEIASQISARASEPITRRMLGEVTSVSYDLGTYMSFSSEEITELEYMIYEEYDVTVKISKAYGVPVYVTFMDSVGDKKTYDGDEMYVYKTKGKWYVVPVFSRGR